MARKNQQRKQRQQAQVREYQRQIQSLTRRVAQLEERLNGSLRKGRNQDRDNWTLAQRNAVLSEDNSLLRAKLLAQKGPS